MQKSINMRRNSNRKGQTNAIKYISFSVTLSLGTLTAAYPFEEG